MFALPERLSFFASRVNEARVPDYDWQAAYRTIALSIPEEDGLAKLFGLVSEEIACDALAGRVNAYHNHLHTLDTIWAMEELCAAASRIGAALPASQHMLKVVMLGHDLRHPGGSGAPAHDLEQKSAQVMAEFARACDVPDHVTAQIVDLILSTRPAHQIAMRAAGAGDLLHLIVGEADVMASLLPGLGLKLGAELTQEMAAAGEPVEAPFESPSVRRSFLRAYLNVSPQAQNLGLGAVIAEQVADLL